MVKESIRSGVDKFVLISTDKAVRPANVMGATKRVAELICQGMNGENKTKFIAVRFGNVLNSAGSVIPLFKEQIMKGGPVTVTHPGDDALFHEHTRGGAARYAGRGRWGRAARYLSSTWESLSRITDLAHDMVRLMGLKVGDDIDIVYTGLRPARKTA